VNGEYPLKNNTMHPNPAQHSEFITCFGLRLRKVWAEYYACVQSSSYPVKKRGLN